MVRPANSRGQAARRLAFRPVPRSFSFGFFQDADSNFAPLPYLSAAVGASDQAVVCRMIWDDESIAAI